MTSKLPHLKTASEFVAGRLPDVCKIIRAGQGEPVTSDVPPFDVTYPADTVVFTGACMVNEQVHRSPTTEVAGQDGQTDTHHARLPASSPRIELGDKLVITGTERDPHLIGLEFDVVDARVATHMVSRRIGLRIRERSPRVL